MNTEVKQKIELEHVEINAKFIHVSGSSTTFINETFQNEINTRLLLGKINKLANICKEKGIKLKGKQKAASLVRSLEEEYSEDYRVYFLLYQQLKELAKEKVEKGIYVGFSDDEELNEISEVRNSIWKMWHRSTALSQIQALNHRIDECLSRANEINCSYTMFNIG